MGGFECQWSTGDNTSAIANLCAGIYYVTVEDSINCVIIDPFILNSPTELIATAYSSNESQLNAKNGSAGVNVEGGIQPYKYLWNTGDSIVFINNLAPGLYIVTVTDSIGCIDVDTVVVDTFFCSDLYVSTQQINVSCYGLCDGSLEIISDTGSTSSLVYKWSNGQDTRLINNLCSGNYYVSITDSSSLCTAVDTFIVTEPDQIIITIDSILNISDSNLGAIFISSNDLGAYIYEWSGPGNYVSNNSNAIGLSEKGCYTLMITGTVFHCSIDTTVCVDKTTSTKDNYNYDLIVYPNPATDQIVLDFGNIDNSNSTISIINSLGRVVFIKKNKVKKQFLNYNINKISTGLFFIKVEMENKLIFKKIIISR